MRIVGRHTTARSAPGDHHGLIGQLRRAVPRPRRRRPCRRSTWQPVSSGRRVRDPESLEPRGQRRSVPSASQPTSSHRQNPDLRDGPSGHLRARRAVGSRCPQRSPRPTPEFREVMFTRRPAPGGLGRDLRNDTVALNPLHRQPALSSRVVDSTSLRRIVSESPLSTPLARRATVGLPPPRKRPVQRGRAGWPSAMIRRPWAVTAAIAVTTPRDRPRPPERMREHEVGGTRPNMLGQRVGVVGHHRDPVQDAVRTPPVARHRGWAPPPSPGIRRPRRAPPTHRCPADIDNRWPRRRRRAARSSASSTPHRRPRPAEAPLAWGQG